MGNCSSTRATTRPHSPMGHRTIRKGDFEYKGETQNGLPHGVGIIEWNDGERY